MIRGLLIALLLCPCEIAASGIDIRTVDEWLILASLGAPGTTKSDIAAGIYGPDDLVVLKKPRIRKKRRK